jgi:hypothetical protein
LSITPPKKLPLVPKELLLWLEATFPDKCPDIRLSGREVWMAAGSVAVVRKLRDIYNKQTQ